MSCFGKSEAGDGKATTKISAVKRRLSSLVGLTEEGELSRTEQKKLNEALLKAVAGYHSETLGWTEGGDLDEIEQLIEQGASLDYVDENGNNAYHEACNKGQLETIECLLDYFPEVLNQRNKYNRTAASIAATGKHLETFAWLVSRGLKYWFGAIIEMEWTDEEILETIDRVNDIGIDSSLLDMVVTDDYGKLDPRVQSELAKRRPKN